MAEITKKQAAEFYHLLYNEVNSTGNTEKNCIALCNFIGTEDIDKGLTTARLILKITKDICFSVDLNSKEKKGVIESLNEAFGRLNEIAKGVEFPTKNDNFITSYCNFITSDIFSQNSPMNEIADVCYTFLNLKNE